MPSSLAGPQARLCIAIFFLVSSITTLLFLYPDTVPIVTSLSDYGYDSGTGSLASNFHHQSALQHDPPPQKRPYGDLVIAARNDTDLSWTTFAMVEWVKQFSNFLPFLC